MSRTLATSAAVTCARRPFAPAVGERFDTIQVTKDGVVTGIRIAIKHEQLAIRGSVVDDTGAPLSDVHVEAITRGPGSMDLPVGYGRSRSRAPVRSRARSRDSRRSRP